MCMHVCVHTHAHIYSRQPGGNAVKEMLFKGVFKRVLSEVRVGLELGVGVSRGIFLKWSQCWVNGPYRRWGKGPEIMDQRLFSLGCVQRGHTEGVQSRVCSEGPYRRCSE